jgi:hypothetical protein
MNAYKMEWKQNIESRNKILVDKDSDPFNDDMLLFEKTQFN